MLLARARNPERLGLQAPGERGALLGLDRAPCPETLRRRSALPAADASALDVWRSALAGDWARDSPEPSATLFVDGRVQVCSGKGRLPMHCVTRRKRSLPAAASYWLGAPGGQPLPCLRKQVDHGEVQAIREDIVPRLESRGLLGPWREGDAPRLTVAFDREGSSPALFAELRAQGIAVPSWVKGAQEERWPDAEFGLDTLPQRGLEDVLAGKTAVNPARRSVGKSLRKREKKLERLQRERQRIRDLRRKRKESPKAGTPAAPGRAWPGSRARASAVRKRPARCSGRCSSGPPACGPIPPPAR